MRWSKCVPEIKWCTIYTVINSIRANKRTEIAREKLRYFIHIHLQAPWKGNHKTCMCIVQSCNGENVRNFSLYGSNPAIEKLTACMLLLVFIIFDTEREIVDASYYIKMTGTTPAYIDAYLEIREKLWNESREPIFHITSRFYTYYDHGIINIDNCVLNRIFQHKTVYTFFKSPIIRKEIATFDTWNHGAVQHNS